MTSNKSGMVERQTNESFCSIGNDGQKSDSFVKYFDSIKSTLNQKNGQYKEDPISVLTADDLLTQIKIKAVRAQLSRNPEKLEDELLDIIVYSLLTWKKISDSKPKTMVGLINRPILQEEAINERS